MPATRTRRQKPGKALVLRRDFIASVEAWKLDWQAYWASPGAGADGWGCPYVDKEAADVLTRGPALGVTRRWYNPVALDDWQEDAVAAARSMAGDTVLELDLQARQAHRDVHSGRPIPEHMTGGCGEADPGTSSVVPLTASSSRIWGPPPGDVAGDGADGWGQLSQDAERHLAAFEQAHDEASDGWARLSPLPDIAELDPEEDLPPGVTPLLPLHEPRQDDEALDEIPWPAPENGHATTPSSTYELDWPQP